MKILCLFVRHGAEQYPDALTVLDKWYERHGLMGQRTLWIIDNALSDDQVPQVLAPQTQLRRGDNRAWEFSAWARAVREARSEQTEWDVVHFVTSAFNTLYTVYLDHFRPSMLGCVTTHHVCLGHIDSYDQPIELAGASSQSWIRTCFFFLPASLAFQFEHWAAFNDPARFFPAANSTRFRHDAPLSSDYQERIRIWLEGQEVGGHKWHSPISSGQEEADRFQKKTLAILNEHSLSIAWRKMNIPLLDFCWLWSQPAEITFNQNAFPRESAQIDVRRRILGIPAPDSATNPL